MIMPKRAAALRFNRVTLVDFIIKARQIALMPAWDMLLYFYGHSAHGAMSITDLCLATRASQRTAVRHIERLEAEGFIERRDDNSDRRRVMLELTPRAIDAINAFLDHVLLSLCQTPSAP